MWSECLTCLFALFEVTAVLSFKFFSRCEQKSVVWQHWTPCILVGLLQLCQWALSTSKLFQVISKANKFGHLFKVLGNNININDNKYTRESPTIALRTKIDINLFILVRCNQLAQILEQISVSLLLFFLNSAALYDSRLQTFGSSSQASDRPLV